MKKILCWIFGHEWIWDSDHDYTGRICLSCGKTNIRLKVTRDRAISDEFHNWSSVIKLIDKKTEQKGIDK